MRLWLWIILLCAVPAAFGDEAIRVVETRDLPVGKAGPGASHGLRLSRPELADTVWIAHGARDLAQVLAHELVHLLSDSGAHSEAPGNLMRAETSPRNMRLTEAQCRRLRSRGKANGLLSEVN